MSIQADDFQLVRELLRRHAAVVLDDGKEYLVEARLTPLATSLNHGSVHDLLDALRAGALDLQQRIVEAMVIHETSFFRDWRPFEALRRDVLPRLVAARARSRELVIWSAACATGQEPYSVAMLLREHFPELQGWSVRVIATDLSRDALARARAGRYGQLEITRGLPAALLVKYFHRDGADWVAREELRRMVEFRELNLAGHGWDLPPFDIVFLRNVMIYFATETRRHVLRSVRRLLRPDGVLCLGTAETTLGLGDDFTRVPIEGSCLFALADSEPRTP